MQIKTEGSHKLPSVFICIQTQVIRSKRSTNLPSCITISKNISRGRAQVFPSGER
jgi:hypothetical protein